MAVSPVGRVLRLSRVLYSIPQYEDDIEIPGPKICEPPFLALFNIFDICSRPLSAETVLHPNELRRRMDRRRKYLIGGLFYLRSDLLGRRFGLEIFHGCAKSRRCRLEL